MKNNTELFNAGIGFLLRISVWVFAVLVLMSTILHFAGSNALPASNDSNFGFFRYFSWVQQALPYAIPATLAMLVLLFIVYSLCSKFRFHLLLSGGFAFIIGASLIHGLAPVIAPSPVAENRKLAEKPVLQWEHVDTLAASFAAWFNDHFELRSNLVSLNSWIKYSIFASSPSDSIIVGKQGWTFYNADQAGDGKSISNYRLKAGFNADQKLAIEHKLNYFKTYLDERKIPFCFFIAPDKISIYPEFAPDYLTKKPDGANRVDQVVAIARAIPGFPIIDMRTAFFAAKKRHEIYFRHGTHWNNYGALIAFLEVHNKMKLFFPHLHAWNESEFTLNEYITHDDNVFSWVGLQHVITSPAIKVQMPDYDTNKRVKLLFAVGDSFIDWLVSYFNLTASNVTRNHWSGPDFFDASLIEKDRPDFVVLEITERYLDTLLIQNSAAGK